MLWNFCCLKYNDRFSATLLPFPVLRQILHKNVTKVSENVTNEVVLVIGMTQLSAKDPVPADTRSISFDWVDYWHTPVVCGGVEVDFLEAELNQHITVHLKNGVLQWYIKEVKGEVTSHKS